MTHNAQSSTRKDSIMKNQSSTYTGTGHITKPGRLYYLDWFRVLAILAVFLHHCGKIFDYRETGLYNIETSFAPTLHREFNALWMMPLFFVISGAAIYFSLKSRTASGFIKERILRIALPLVLIGTFVINPPQVYILRLFHGQFSGGLFQWYPHFFDGLRVTGGNFIPLGLGTHLWYLMDLFLFSLMLLPLFMPRKKDGTSVLSRISSKSFCKSLGIVSSFRSHLRRIRFH